MKFNNKYFTEYQDNYNIYNLIKIIDDGYKLYFNNYCKNFAIVNTSNNYEICMEFNNFNDNILQKLRFSRIENSNKLFDYIEEYNSQLEIKKEKSFANDLTDKMYELASFSKRTNNITESDIGKINGENLC